MRVAKRVREIETVLDRFIYSCAHDLKGPLSSIQGLVMLAEKQPLPDETRDCLGMISTCVHRMDALIHTLELYMTQTQRPLKIEAIQADQLLDSVVKSFQDDIVKNNIQISVRSEINNTEWISDRYINYLIITNLIANAVQFFDCNKKDRRVLVNLTVKSSEAIFEVVDNGTGIAPEHLDRIFNAFYKASEKSTGYGLGLFLVRELANRLKAKLSFESYPGVGTSVKIIFPNPSTL